MKIDNFLLEEILNIKNIPLFSAKGISIDSRTIRDGELFIAINNGHKFVRDALEAGASAVLIDDPSCEIAGKTVLVPNTTEALKSIGTFIKNKVNLKKLVAITGSTGKTTTKMWLGEILSHKYKTFSGVGNYNTIYGVPIALSLLEKETEFGIFEMGSNHCGEISELSDYLKPDIGVITNIYESHIGNFGDKETLANEKISIIDGINDGGSLVFNGDSEFSERILASAKEKGLKTFSVGFSGDCDFVIQYWDSRKIKLKTPIGEVEYEVSFLGKHFAYVSASVIAIIYAMGLDVFEFLPFYKNLSPVEGRGDMKKYVFNNKDFYVINDSYNASPASMCASLESLQLRDANFKIAVIGQMKELGIHEEYYHAIVAEKLASLKLDFIFFIGDENLWSIMKKGGNVKCFKEFNDFVIEKILEIIQNDSIVLLKGSHSLELSKFVKYLECSIV